jgi:hypothetical protein
LDNIPQLAISFEPAFGAHCVAHNDPITETPIGKEILIELDVQSDELRAAFRGDWQIERFTSFLHIKLILFNYFLIY